MNDFRTLVQKPARAMQSGQGPHVYNRRDTREHSGMYTLIKFINIIMKTKNANAGTTPAAIAATRVRTFLRVYHAVYAAHALHAK